MSPSKKSLYEIPKSILEQFGPFVEFKQDGAFVSVDLSDGRTYSGILLVSPNWIAAMEGYETLPFDPAFIVRVYQTATDLKRRSSSSWTFWI